MAMARTPARGTPRTPSRTPSPRNSEFPRRVSATFFLERIFIDPATLDGTRPNSPAGAKPAMAPSDNLNSQSLRANPFARSEAPATRRRSSMELRRRVAGARLSGYATTGDFQDRTWSAHWHSQTQGGHSCWLAAGPYCPETVLSLVVGWSTLNPHTRGKSLTTGRHRMGRGPQLAGSPNSSRCPASIV